MMFYGVKLHVVTMLEVLRSVGSKVWNAFTAVLYGLLSLVSFGPMLIAERLPSRKGVTQLSGVIIGIVVVMMVAIVGVLIGGVFTQKTSQIFTDQNVSSEWVNLANQASSYSITGLSLLLIGIIVAAAMSVIAIIVAYFRQRT